jgi:hypothetical protein
MASYCAARSFELLFNLEHPEQLALVTEVNEEGDDEDDELIDDEADSSEDELQRRFDRMTFVAATRKLEQLPQWVKVTEVFKSDSDRPFLERAGITDLEDPRSEKYSQRLARPGRRSCYLISFAAFRCAAAIASYS